MIKKFRVKNFRGFKDWFEFDLSNTRDYEFNSNLIKNKIINKAIIYGKNGSGKSNLGFALYDITSHLTDKQKDFGYSNNYNNFNTSEPVEFEYSFQFENDEILYEYKKHSYDQLIYEKLTFPSGEHIIYDYEEKKHTNTTNLYTNLNIELTDNTLSIIKYIFRNTPIDEASPITKVVRFAEGMLSFRCLIEGITYMGFKTGNENLNDIILKNKKLADFEDFLRKNGLDYKLVVGEENGKPVIKVRFDKYDALFSIVASSGTKALWLFYCWSLSFSQVSFLYLDEFDAYYHYEIAESILQLVNSIDTFQAVVTTHNTYLMNNKLTRPDCCLLIFDNESIKALSQCTEKEIREAHNLEKMYRNGAFVD